MNKNIHIKIYPSKEQTIKIEQTLGMNRKVWNSFLNLINERYDNNTSSKMLSYYDMNALLTQFKKENPWMYDLDSKAPQYTLKRLSESFKRFFKGISKYPKFKTKKDLIDSYTTKAKKTLRFNSKNSYIRIPKIGWVKCKTGYLNIEKQNIVSITVKRDNQGKYYGIVLIKSENQTLRKTGKRIGIDLGVADLAILSDGTKYSTLNLYRQYKNKLLYWEQRMNRRRIRAKKMNIPLEESKNYQYARKQVARIHHKIANVRKNYIHKVTTEIVKKYDLIVIEDLKINNMMKNRKLSKSISNQSWRMFREMLQYKCEWYGKELRIVNPYKTSQICSSCGHDSGKKTLDIRQWKCEACNTLHDRDINASKNILKLGLE